MVSTTNEAPICRARWSAGLPGRTPDSLNGPERPVTVQRDNWVISLADASFGHGRADARLVKDELRRRIEG